MDGSRDKSLITREAVFEVLGAYWSQYKKHPAWSIITFILPPIGTVLVFFVPPLIIAKIINLIAKEGTVSFSSAGRYIFLFIILWVLGELCWRIGTHFLIKIEAEGIKNLNEVAHRKLAYRDYDFFTDNFVGSLVNRVRNFARGFEAVTDTLSSTVLTSVFPLIFAVIVLWRYSLWIPIILAIWVILGVFIAVPIIRRRSKLVAERHEASSKLAGTLSDSITNILVVKAFSQEDQEEVRFKSDTKDYTDKLAATGNYQNLRFYSIMSPIFVISNATGLLAAIFFINQLNLEAGALVVIFSYYQQITNSFWSLSNIYRGLESSVSEAAQFNQLLINPPKVEDFPGAGELKPTNSAIEFMSISFKYSDGKNENDEGDLFLHNFNLKVSERERVGLVGPSGGGKTTITKLLLRFIDPKIGQIMIGDQNIREVTQKSLREAISYVPQEPLLFHRSLFENIAYGKDDATIDEVISAAKLAHAHEFISTLPRGYQTLVGERGIKLSGGQRQRVAIARAILKNAPILVLDEATSSLDSESEKHIQEGLWELMKDKTALVIAHRLSTIKHLDRIIVLDGGKVVQDGTHEELVKQPGLYATLWSHQSGSFLGE